MYHAPKRLAVVFALASLGHGLCAAPSRRAVLRKGVATAVAGALSNPTGAEAKPLSQLSRAEIDALDLSSRSADGRVLPSGVRIIDVNSSGDDSPLPQKGDRVYAHFKVWTRGFRSGPPVDSSFLDTRPYDWRLGQPDGRIRPGFDEGTQGMREGDWRRLVVPGPLAYGEAGLRQGKRTAFAVEPDEAVFVDLLMVDGGSGKCDEQLRVPYQSAPNGMPEFAHDGGMRSISCARGKP